MRPDHARAGLHRLVVVVEHERCGFWPCGREPHVRRSVGRVAAAVTGDEPWMPASEEPKPSFTMSVRERGRGCAALQPADIGAPPLEIDEERSTRPGARRVGVPRVEQRLGHGVADDGDER